MGGPDGGDGGRGGDVVLVGDASLDTLGAFRYRRLYKAQPGGSGLGNLKHGKRGLDVLLPVPLGTLAYRDGEPLGEILEQGQRLVVGRAGKGGRGNKHFATSVHQAPRFAEKGGEGEEGEVRLELRLLADAGLVGLPNAGKSTLLARVSAAQPKIADYPFTTLEPQLGVVEIEYDRFRLADMPGLIAGASQGTGLGEEFLGHIQRTAVLLHVVAGTSDHILTDAEQINTEMRAFDPALMRKPQLLVVNKIDLPEVRARKQAIEKALKSLGLPIHFISAETGVGVMELMKEAWAIVKQAREAVHEVDGPAYQVFRPLGAEGYRVHRVEGKYILEGPDTPELVVPHDVSAWEYGGILRERLRRTHWRRVIERAGVKAGDVIEVGGVEIEW